MYPVPARRVHQSGFASSLGIAFVLLSAGACSDDPAIPTPPPPPVASVEVSAPSAALEVGQTAQLTATARDARGNALAGREITWASSDTTRAVVDGAGQARARGPGLVAITASSEGKSGSAQLKLVWPPAAVVAVSASRDSVLERDTLHLLATARSRGGDPLPEATFRWSSSDTTVAMVNDSGVLTTRRPGGVVITALSEQVAGTIALEVLGRRVAAVRVEPASIELEAGLTRQLKVVALDSEGVELLGRAPSFMIEHSGVATVELGGTVTARSEGATTVRVSVGGLQASVPVTVTRRQAITAILDSIRAVYDVPALGAAIITPGGIWALDAVGTRRAGGTVPVTANDRFHIGSNLKAATAALIGRLVDQGRLRWDLTLAEAFPELVADMRPEYRTLSLVDLLAHRTGWGPHVDVAMPPGTPREQRVAATAWIVRQPPEGPAGAFAYSGRGYVVAGALAERVTNRPFEVLLIEQLFKPLGGGESVGFGAPSPDGGDAQPSGHWVSPSGERRLANGDNPPVVSPGGTAHMSLADWARYVGAVLRGELGQPTIWQPETARRLTAVAAPFGGADGYALGWMRLTRAWGGGGQVIWHNGSNNAHYSEATIIPARGFAVLVVTNQGPIEGPTPAEMAARRAVETTTARLITLYTENR